jgi:hypothetical protein
MSNTLTYQQMGTTARGQTHALFAQTMAASRQPPPCSRSAPGWAAP